jgi:hypothetical protein
MRIAALIIFAVLIVLAAAAALLFMFPGLKEGTSHEELPFLIGGIFVCLGLGAAWWRVVGRSWAMAIPIWLILAIPALLATSQTVSMVTGLVTGLRLERATTIDSYSEIPITWAGFDGPVGMTIRFDLPHPPGSEGLILPPEIRMGPTLDIPRHALSATQTGGSGTFKDFFLDQKVADLTLLKTVLFQRLYINDSVEREIHQWTSSARFAPGDRTSLVFHLHPGFVDYLVSESRVCLSKKAPGVPLCGDTEDPKTDAYAPCPAGEDTHNAFRLCYCRD